MAAEKTVLLEASGLTMTYSGCPRPALRNVSFTLSNGEFCGLIGPNGAGKTTLLSILTTLLVPGQGQLRINGMDVLTTPRQVLPAIGYVPQDLALYDRLTGRENLMFFGRMCGLDGRLLRQRAVQYLEMFGLKDRADQKVAHYSGGMKRRINLIAGLLHQPRLLFLDEPTVGVDAQSRNLILHQLEALNRQGMTILYSTHYFEEVEHRCHRVFVIDAGEIIAAGAPRQLIAELDGCASLTDFFLRKTGAQLRD